HECRLPGMHASRAYRGISVKRTLPSASAFIWRVTFRNKTLRHRLPCASDAGRGILMAAPGVRKNKIGDENVMSMNSLTTAITMNVRDGAAISEKGNNFANHEQTGNDNDRIPEHDCVHPDRDEDHG